MKMRFWNLEGLRTLGKLIDDSLTLQGMSQNTLGKKAEVSSSSIGYLRRNRLAVSEGSFSLPDPDTVLAIAPYIINPDTNQPFDPEDFLKVGRGHKSIHKYNQGQSPMDEIIAEIKSKLAEPGWSEARLVRETRISQSTLDSILRGELPTMATLMRLAKVVRSDRSPSAWAEALGIETEVSDRHHDHEHEHNGDPTNCSAK